MDLYALKCRLCETTDRLNDSKWLDLFSAGNETLLMKIEACTSVVIRKADSLPKRICDRCNTHLQQAYSFRVQCEITDAKLRREIELLQRNDWDIGESIKKEDNQERTDTCDGLLDIKVKQSEQNPEEELYVIFTEDSDPDVSLSKIKKSLEAKEDQSADDGEEQIKSEINDSAESDPAEPSEKKSRLRIKSEEHDEKTRSNICETCGEQFEKASQLYKHTRSVHGKKRFQCSTCSKWFYRRTHLRDHQLRHSGIRQFECTKCDRKYVTQKGLKTHVDSIHSDEQPYVCDKCGTGFAKPGMLRNHYSTHIESRDFLCGVCSKGYKTKSQLDLHMNIHLPLDQKKAKKKRRPEKPCICQFCGKVSNSLAAHKLHVRQHTGEQRYECHICPKRFISFGSHKKHLLVHSGERPYSCEFCQKAFRQKHHLTTHTRSVHTNEKPYECKFCLKTFVTKGNMMLHLRIHTGADAKSKVAADSSNI
ncbi:zinc finger protein OZF-like [Toxorhynchites rutilus septentrionalis]|uniref:zinc finger protein OZF-like n=1 Tax=Toxorhynchites rutilus septentrionalis TaxID=329112 RepID=UPI00247A2D4F|nr:zinc finger protein OZF-like [Toxorhynchites rutilus septentrionalis]